MEITVFNPQLRDETFELVASAKDLDIHIEDYSLDDDIRVICQVHRDGNVAIVKGEAIAPVKVNCSRCLEPYVMEVSGTFTLVVRQMPVGEPVPQLSPEEEELDEERLLYVEHDVAALDIINYVRDAVILAMPLKPVCREDCRGLCFSCGHNLNEGECGCEPKIKDPRWQALSEILSGEESLKKK
jgi:uncharacterized protein